VTSASADEHELWASYGASASRAAHQQLFFRYVPWARTVARDVYRRVRIPQMDWGDYAHNATVGLLEAMSRFDVARGVDFIAYAKPRVRGAVFNGLRSYLSESGRRDEMGRWRDRMESFDAPEFDDPLNQMVATIANLGLGFLLDSGAASELSQANADASAVAERHQMDRVLEGSLARLPEKERQVLILHYYQHMPFVEIAALFRLSKGRISQIHKSAIENIRKQIEAIDDLGTSA
jgi:RNA polymerase sigma factor for flagellar operon FliA